MEDTNQGIADNASDSAQNAGSSDNTIPDGSDKVVTELMSKKGWKAPVDIARGYEEVERAKSRAEAELAEIRRKYDEAKERADLAAAVKELAGTNARQPRNSEPDEAIFLKQFNEQLTGDNPGQAILKLMRDYHTTVKSEVSSEVARLTQDRERLENELRDLRESTDEFYVKNRAKVDELTKTIGISKQQAIKTLKVLNTNAGEGGRLPPASVAPTVRTTPQPGKKAPLTSEDIRKMKTLGWTAEEIAKEEKRRQ